MTDQLGGSKWGAGNFQQKKSSFSYGSITLEHSIRQLPARVKQAFYGAAIRKGTIRRKTWDGCAFNEGGVEIGDIAISSHLAAADAFGISTQLVTNFITAWDGSSYVSDLEATQALIGILESVGIFTEPEDLKAEAVSGIRAKRIINETVWESTIPDKELHLAFANAVIGIDGTLDQWDSGLEALLNEAEKVLELV